MLGVVLVGDDCPKLSSLFHSFYWRNLFFPNGERAAEKRGPLTALFSSSSSLWRAFGKLSFTLSVANTENCPGWQMELVRMMAE